MMRQCTESYAMSNAHPGLKEVAKYIAPSDTVIIKPGAVYGGLSVSRGAGVPDYVTGLRRYTVEAVAVHKGVTEALLAELMSWIAVCYLTVI